MKKQNISYLFHKFMDEKPERFLFLCGLVLLAMELWKQGYLYFVYFEGHYNVWYFPFQLCSVPMYLALFYGCAGNGAVKRTAAGFMRDFGILGGVAALLVHGGFTYPGHFFLTAHGYVWHLILILMGVYIQRRGLAGHEAGAFGRELALFAGTAAVAECWNVLLHPFGDCDMFYISPYHFSSQPVFHQIDALIGRPAGIALYLCCVALGAFAVHRLTAYVAVTPES